MWVSVFILRTNCAMAHKRDRAMKTPTIEKQLRKLLFLVACVMKRRDKIFSCCFTLLCFFLFVGCHFSSTIFPILFPTSGPPFVVVSLFNVLKLFNVMLSFLHCDMNFCTGHFYAERYVAVLFALCIWSLSTYECVLCRFFPFSLLWRGI